MSIASWKNEFYSKPARKFRVKEGQEPTLKQELAAVEHSIIKWIGLRQENLDKHQLRPSDDNYCIDGPAITGSLVYDEIEIDAGTCALCVQNSSQCESCPIVRATGATCHWRTFARTMVKPPPEAQEKLSPYFVWLNRQNPEPMIRLLERTREFVQAEIEEAKCT